MTNSDINSAYSNGFVLTRKSKDTLEEINSLRIEIKAFDLSSENRRVLSKFPNFKSKTVIFDELSAQYRKEIAQTAEDFYKKANVVFTRESMLRILFNLTTFNKILIFYLENEEVGWAILYQNEEICHYAYPFYNYDHSKNNLGMRMMLEAIIIAKELGLKYIYLGGSSRRSDIYKSQFSGIQRFHEGFWQTNIDMIKFDINRNKA